MNSGPVLGSVAIPLVNKPKFWPTAHVAKTTDIYNEPSAGSDASFTAGPKTALYVVEDKGKWTFVENEEGDGGYVLHESLAINLYLARRRERHESGRTRRTPLVPGVPEVSAR